jgi:hypothetical protein
MVLIFFDFTVERIQQIQIWLRLIYMYVSALVVLVSLHIWKSVTIKNLFFNSCIRSLDDGNVITS